MSVRVTPLLLTLLSGSAALGACQRGSEHDATPTPVAATAEPVDPRTLFEPLPTEIEYDATTVALGNQLYHDPGLSVDGTLSCASCHNIAAGGDDGRATSLGVRDQAGPINAPTVLNARYHLAQFWDGRAEDLHAQAMGPMTNPIEMGATEEHVVAYVQSVPDYVAAFEAAGYEEITFSNVAHAIASFEETLVTPSRFDDYLRGDDGALSEQELAGMHAFVEVGCTGCHQGPAMGGTMFQKMGLVRDYFASRGGELTDADLGRFNHTGEERDRHQFKVPTLRNVELTAPYFHDGSVAELDDAVRIMGEVQLGRDLSEAEVADIVAFLEALTGSAMTLADVTIPPALPAAPSVDQGEEPGAPTAEGASVELK